MFIICLIQNIIMTVVCYTVRSLMCLDSLHVIASPLYCDVAQRSPQEQTSSTVQSWTFSHQNCELNNSLFFMNPVASSILL